MMWVRFCIPVLVTMAVLAGPVLAVAPQPAACCDAGESCTACATDEQACCLACADAEKSCCQRDQEQPSVEPDTGCGSCPPGQCDCCQSLRGVTLACETTGLELSPGSPLAVPVTNVDSLFLSRSDEPLLPPPIGAESANSERV